ncbi:HNH endonuclease signature motif containing protein [Blastococcus sp. PRF04-17]|uniref:HNH endonuclease signature motif containing protein n=1 Tax=Blastococcus sp. PRF04-17 TaxID=2933797 RepID=UPI0027381E7A|nr:HNH endonuclease signature motif containing protein [Blastococcus sp. PRF04-17]
MFDELLLDRSDRGSRLEAGMRAWRRAERPPLIDVGHPPAGEVWTVERAGHRPDGDDPRGLRQLLETGAGHLDVAAAAFGEQGRLAAVQARALAAFAACRPAAAMDRPDDEAGAAAAASRAARPAVLTEVSEWAVDEVMARLTLSAQAAARLLEQSVILVELLPATLDACQAGVISWTHAVMLTEVLPVLTDPAVRAAVEARLLARAADKTVPQLRAAARRAVLKADPNAALRRAARAIGDRQVQTHPGRDGVGSLTATGLSTPVLAACYRALQAYAAASRTPDDPRTQDQRMTDCLVDLILRPDANHPPVQIALTLIAGVNTMSGGDDPGELDGHPIPAAMVRALAAALGLLPRTPPPPAEPATTEPATTEPATTEPATTEPATTEPATTEPATTEAATTEPATTEPTATEATAEPAARAALAELLDLRAVTGTALAHLPALAVVDELTGQLLALTTAAGLRTGQALDPPGPTPGYAPATALQKFVRARDRRCRFPGCRTPAIRCDLDHNQPWPLGPTSADNLCCLCRHHHRLSHQAPGWRMQRRPDGGLQWTTPGGHTITTHPQPYGTDDLPPPPPAQPPRPGLTLRERVLGRPPTPAHHTDDPAPF